MQNAEQMQNAKCKMQNRDEIVSLHRSPYVVIAKLQRSLLHCHCEERSDVAIRTLCKQYLPKKTA